MYMYVIDLHFFTQQIDYININQLQVHSYFILITLVLYANILKNPLYFFFGGGSPAFGKHQHFYVHSRRIFI